MDEEGLLLPPPSPPPSPWFLRGLVALSALGGFLFGYDTGIVSGAMVLVVDDLDLAPFQHEVVVSATIFTAILGAAASAPLNKACGRRPCIILASAVFVAGSVLLGAAPSFRVLVAGRLVVGGGIGIASMTVPMFIAEVAPPESRGTLVTLNNLFITGGQFFASLVSAGFATWLPINVSWRWMFGLGALPAIIQMVGFVCCMPESPRWLALAGQQERARAVLMRIRGATEGGSAARAAVEEEIAGWWGGERVDRRAPNKSSCWNDLRHKVCRVPHVRRALLLGAGLQFLQQMVGINTVMYYGATIVQMAGFSGATTAIYANVGLAATNFLFTLVGLALVDRVGRRRLLLGSLAGVVVSLCALGGAFYVNEAMSLPSTGVGSASITCGSARHARCFSCVTDTHCGFCANITAGTGTCLPMPTNQSRGAIPAACASTPASWNLTSCDTGYAWMSVVFLVLYLACFAPGMGPMPWTVNSEIYPRDVRSTCVGIATSVNWLSNLVVSFTFLSLIEAFTAKGAFWFYSGVGLVGFFAVSCVMPETRGLELRDIVEKFKKKGVP